MDFAVRIQGLDQLVSQLQKAPEIAVPILKRALTAAHLVLAKNTKKGIVPWRSGALVQSFRSEIEGMTLRWFPTVAYAPYVEFGTAPHVIVPKDKRALFWQGAAHPVLKVNHPGTKANPYMERILTNSQPEIDSLFLEALTRISTAIAK